MRWLHRLRIRLFPVTYAAAPQHVDTIDQALAELRPEVAALPAQERVVRAADVRELIANPSRDAVATGSDSSIKNVAISYARQPSPHMSKSKSVRRPSSVTWALASPASPRHKP